MSEDINQVPAEETVAAPVEETTATIPEGAASPVDVEEAPAV